VCKTGGLAMAFLFNTMNHQVLMVSFLIIADVREIISPYTNMSDTSK
jgi:hypothetical protein